MKYILQSKKAEHIKLFYVNSLHNKINKSNSDFKQKLLLSLFVFLIAISSNAQIKDSRQNAITFSVSPSLTTNLNNQSTNSNQVWYSFTATSGAMQFVVNSNSSYVNRITHASIYSGNCGSLIIEPIRYGFYGDTALSILTDYCVVGQTYFLVLQNNTVTCSECINDSMAHYNLSNKVNIPSTVSAVCNPTSLNCEYVNNGDFESFTPNNNGTFNIADACFMDFANGTPDYYNSGYGATIAGVPANGEGCQAAHSGNGYAGIGSYEPGNNNTEQIKMFLKNPMRGGESFLVSFWVSLTQESQYAIKEMSACFTTTGNYSAGALSITNTGGTLLEGWTQITGTVTVPIGQCLLYMTIGNFLGGNATATAVVPNPCATVISPEFTDCYYYIDDISVTKIAAPPLTVSSATTGCTSYTVTTPNASTCGVPLTYSWSDGGTGLTSTGVTHTPEIITVSALTPGCNVPQTGTVAINVPILPPLSFTVAPPSKCTGTFGNFNLHVGAATPPYTWSTGGVPLGGHSANYDHIDVSPTLPGVYTFTCVGSNCSGYGTVTFTVNPLPIFSVSAFQPNFCYGSTSSSATLTASDQSLNYSWAGSMLSSTTGSVVVANPVPSSIAAAYPIYTVHGTDANGCVGTQTVQIEIAKTPTITVTHNSPILYCSGSIHTVTLNGLGVGTGGTYAWSNGQVQPSIVVSPSVSTTYYVTGTTAAGCSAQNAITVTVTPNPIVSATTSTPSVCYGGAVTLTAVATPTNSTTTYAWATGSYTGNPVIISPLTATKTFTVSVNTNGCIGKATVTEIVNPLPVKPIISGVFCSGTDGVLTITNSVSGETYTWATPLGGSVGCNNPPVCSSETIYNAIAGGVYSVTATDANGCVSPTATIVPKTAPNVSISHSSLVADCANGPAKTYTLTGNVSPGTIASNTYSWSTGVISHTITVTPTNPVNIYTLTGTSGTTGCVNTATLEIDITPNPTVTITASPVCTGASATLTASGTPAGITGYTWAGQGATGGLQYNNPFYTPVFGTTPKTYTLTGNYNGCPGVAIIMLNPLPRPVVTVAASPTNICQGSSSTLSANGALSYTWTPSTSVSPSTGSPVIATPSITTQYTVQGTDANGCISYMVYDNVNVTPSPTLSITAPTHTICQGSSVNLTAHGSTNYTWTPDPSLSTTTGSVVIASPSVTTVYTVASTSTVGCNSIGTITITVTPAPSLTITAAANPICSGTNTTLTASGATTYTWTNGAGLGINSTNNHSVTITTPNLTSTVTYTVTGTGIGGCKGSTVLTVTVTPPPTVSFSITTHGNCASTSTAVCSGDPVTITASSSTATDYTWNPGGSNANPITVTPTSNTTYTVYATDGVCASTVTTTVFVTNCAAGLAHLPTHGGANNGNYIAANSFTLTGNLNISGSIVSVGPNVTITVPTGTVLNISNSHIKALSNSMWQGIVVQPGGTVNVINNSLVEDAIVAIDNNPASTPQNGVPAKINVNGAVFNCNRTSVRQAFYQSPSNGYYSPTYFDINNSVITCRCGITYPVTMSTLNTYVGNIASPDLTDYYSVANFTAADLKYPYAGQPAYEGVHFENNGVQGTNGSSLPLPFMYNIGNLGGSNLVLFDALTYGVNAINTTFSVTASAFQMPHLAGARLPTIGGYGILANVTAPDWYNGIYVDNSRFIRMIKGIKNINYYEIELNNNIIFSRQTIPTLQSSSIIPPEGGAGIFSQSVRFQEANMNNNTIVNINNGIDFVIDQATYNGGNGEYVGDITVNSNAFDKQFANTQPNTYAGNAIVVTNVITPTGTTTTGPGVGSGTKIHVQNNTINNVFRGILLSNHEYQEVRDENNTITMLFEPSFNTLPTTQYGIQHAKVGATPPPGSSTIYNNKVMGLTSGSTNQSATDEAKKAIWVNQTRYHYVTCNNVVNAGRGFEFTGAHLKLIWRLNNITNCGEGLALTSATGGANMGPQGQPNDASDNQWSGSGFADTYTDLNSVPSNSPLYVQYSSLPYGPTNNVVQLGGIASYNYLPGGGLNQPNSPSNTYLCGNVIVGREQNPNTSRNANARNAQSNNSVYSNTATDINLLEQIVQDSLLYMNDSTQNDFINKNIVYRSLAQDNSLMDSSVILQNFYTANQTTYRHTYCVIEDSLHTGNYTYAASLVSTLSPSCLIEQNYKRFYQIYINNKLGVGTASDTSDLETLAGSCPLLNGMVVLQARSFHNSMYNNFKHYEDNCPQSTIGNNRLSKNQNVLPLNKTASLYVYPNPSTGRVYISGFDGNQKTAVIEITDITGKLIYKQQNNLSNGMVELNLPFVSGVYFVHAVNSIGVMQIQKLVITY